MPFRVCALTSSFSARIKHKPDGECLQTQLARQKATYEAHPHVRCTKCDGCHATICCSCLDIVAEVADGYRDRIMYNDVWKALVGRAWRPGSAQFDGFKLHSLGGGNWLGMCPLCVEQVFSAPAELVPKTLNGENYLTMEPWFQQYRFFVECRVPSDDGAWRPMQRHSVALYVLV